MNDAKISITLSEEERTALEAVCRRRKVEALVWKRARAFLLLDAGEDRVDSGRGQNRTLRIFKAHFAPDVLSDEQNVFPSEG